MNKTFKTYAVIFVIVMIILALLEVNKKETTDWRKNFDINEKSPFGLFVFNNEGNIFLKIILRRLNRFLMNITASNKKGAHNIVVIENNLDGESWKKFCLRYLKVRMHF